MSSPARLTQTDFRLCPKCNKLHTGLTTCPTCSSPLTLLDYKFFLNKSLGKYTIENILGVGGMGIVFQGLHTTLNKKVAIKIFIPTTEDTSFEKRFLREARILAALKHPNIIEVYDFDISEWGAPFYVMEYLEGKTLGDELKKYPKGVPFDLIPTFLEPLIHGLSHAHKKGIVHRDLKPENIFIEDIHGKQVLKILDFGIAKSMAGGIESTNVTITKTLLGTPYYLSPEQILNKNIGPHTDQYALALIIAEMLTGVVIRGGKTMGEILYKEVHKPIKLEDFGLKKMPAEVNQTLAKATLPEPEKRFPDIDSFGTVFLRALENQPLKGDPLITVSRHLTKKSLISNEDEVRLKAKKKKKIRITIDLLVVLLLAAVIYFLEPFGKIGGEKETEPVSKQPQKVEKDFIRLKQTITVPHDTDSILTSQGNILVIQAVSDICLIDIKDPGNYTRIQLEERILRGLPEGDIVFIDDFTITSRNFIDDTDNLLVRNPPVGEIFKISKSKEYLATKKGTVLTLFRIEEEKLHEIKSITLSEESPGFSLEISDKYLVFISSGKIHGFLLDSGDEILTQPFEATAVKTIAIQDTGDLMAVADEDKRIYLYNLKKAIMVQTFSEPGNTLAIDFFPGSPFLIIAKEGKLFLRGIKDGILRPFKDPGLKIIDIAVTTFGLIALDKNANKINIFSLDRSWNDRWQQIK